MNSRDLMEALIGFLKSEKGHSMTISDLERAIQDGGRELLLSLLQSHLDTRSPGEAAAPVRDAQEVERERVQLHERNVETVFGTATVTRAGYGAAGKQSLHPLDAALNLPEELYSLEVRRRVAEEAAKNSFDETMQTIVRNTGAEVPKRQVGELVVRAAQDFDLFYATRRDCMSAEGATGPIVVISVDGKGVVMRREDLRKATRKAAESTTHKMSKRLSRGEKRNAKRMATVAVTYTIEPHVRSAEDIVRRMAPIRTSEPGKRPAPELKRVWASLKHPPESVIAEAFNEAGFRDPHRQKSWVALVDGNKTQIKILKAKAQKTAIDLTIVVDIIHVSEYLWDAGTAFHNEATPDLEQWVTERLLEILRGNPSNVAAGMRRSATLRGLAPNERKPVDSCANYLLKYKPYLRYDEYLIRGFPIATGVIEGACRHLVKDRMDLTGARWTLASAEAVLRLRALRCCGDFDEYWGFHEALEHERNHASKYAANRPPAVVATHTQEPIRFKRVK